MARFFQHSVYVITRLLRYTRSFLGVALLALWGCAKQETPSKTSASEPAALPKVRFLTDWYPQAEHGGYYQALMKGYYKAAGLDVEIVPGGPGVTVPQKMASGNADFAMGSSQDLIALASIGLPFVIVAAPMQHDPQAILLHEDSPIRSFGDLNGKTVMAVPGSGWIDYLKAQYHIEFSIIPSNFGIAQFVADKNFIQQCYVTNEPYFVGEQGIHARTLLIANSGYNPYRIIYTTQRFAREHPEQVKAFVAATIQGWEDFMNGDPSPAKAEIVRRNAKMSEGLMNFTIAAMRDQKLVGGKTELGERAGKMTRMRLEEQVRLLVSLKLIAKPIPLEQFASFAFLPPDRKEP